VARPVVVDDSSTIADFIKKLYRGNTVSTH